jgi:hypothetical protein
MFPKESLPNLTVFFVFNKKEITKKYLRQKWNGKKRSKLNMLQKKRNKIIIIKKFLNKNKLKTLF